MIEYSQYLPVYVKYNEEVKRVIGPRLNQTDWFSYLFVIAQLAYQCS